MPDPPDRKPEPGPDPASDLLPEVYRELRDLAARYLGPRHGGDLTIQPTAIVHEAYLRLARGSSDWNSRTHFFAIAAVAMRQVLVDHLRARGRAKRGGGWQQVTLAAAEPLTEAGTVDLLALDEALTQLAELDARAARVVALRFFGGLTEAEIAAHLEVAPRTVRNDWTMARAWLRAALAETSPGDDS